MAKRIAIGSDHGGFALKEKVIEILKKAKYTVKDLGPESKASCDYPAYGYDVARAVALKKADKGIVICTSGIGMSIVANKVPGIRAGLCTTVEDASSARRHNDANVLVLAARRTKGKKAEEIVKTWLKTKALKGRHARRVDQIKAIDRKVFKKIK